MKLLVINGEIFDTQNHKTNAPNLKQALKDLEWEIINKGDQYKLEMHCWQSSIPLEIAEMIQKAPNYKYKGLIINFGATNPNSNDVLSALNASKIPLKIITLDKIFSNESHVSKVGFISRDTTNFDHRGAKLYLTAACELRLEILQNNLKEHKNEQSK